MNKQPKVWKIDDSAFFVLGDYTVGIVEYEYDWAQTSPILGEPFEKIPETEDVFKRGDFVKTLKKVARPVQAQRAPKG